MSVILENNKHLVELKSKNQILESKINEYENKLKNTQQLLEKNNNFKNTGTFKYIIINLQFNLPFFVL